MTEPLTLDLMFPLPDRLYKITEDEDSLNDKTETGALSTGQLLCELKLVCIPTAAAPRGPEP